jgi:hypothetical protein
MYKKNEDHLYIPCHYTYVYIHVPNFNVAMTSRSEIHTLHTNTDVCIYWIVELLKLAKQSNVVTQND